MSYETNAQKGLQLEGFEELFKSMDALAEEIGKGKTDAIWRKALSTAMEPVLRAALSNAPVESGQLKAHVYSKAHRPQGRDKKASSYAGEIFMARVTAGPKREGSAVLMNKKGNFFEKHRPVALAAEFGNARNKNRKPFLRPALESNYQNVIDLLGRAIWAEVNWGKYAKKG